MEHETDLGEVEQPYIDEVSEKLSIELRISVPSSFPSSKRALHRPASLRRGARSPGSSVPESSGAEDLGAEDLGISISPTVFGPPTPAGPCPHRPLAAPGATGGREN